MKIKIDKLANLITEIVYGRLYEMEVIMKFNPEENLTDILTNIRLICGVAIVNVAVASKKISDTTEVVRLSIKFRPLASGVKPFLRKIHSTCKGIKGVYTFKIVKVKDISDQQAKKGD